MVGGGSWPDWLNNKPALMRAYKKTILVDGDGDDWVQKREFNSLLLNIFWFNKLWQIFAVMDEGHDRRIDAAEFARGMSSLGLRLSAQQAKVEFDKIDENHGGQVLFVEFCAYVRSRVHPDANRAVDADILSGEKCNQAWGGAARKGGPGRGRHAFSFSCAVHCRASRVASCWYQNALDQGTLLVRSISVIEHALSGFRMLLICNGFMPGCLLYLGAALP
ncbi:unnamed protein product [Polarella glacialis]|uniref:EF-hand domain-containing protein n=1 Tax=Polarella glacialis TaxID=89957 RepID=A0A813LWU8_POLGL|nr:unnamed protein product [Polarella glacialis]